MVRAEIVVAGGWGAEPVLAAVPLQTVGVEFYDGLSVLGQAAVHFAVTVAVGLVVFGMLPGYTKRVVDLARRSPVISIVIGLPSVSVLATLVAIGHLISGTDLGVFFAIPLVTAGFTLLPPFMAFGLTVVGAMLGTRMGARSVVSWIVFGGVVAAAAAVSPTATLLASAVAAVVGTGAGVRVFADTGLATEVEERTVPPANNV